MKNKIILSAIAGVLIMGLFLSSTTQNAEAKGYNPCFGINSSTIDKVNPAYKDHFILICGIRADEKPLKDNNNNNQNNNNNNNQNNQQNNSGCVLSKYVKTCTADLLVAYPGGKGHAGQTVKTSLTLSTTATDKTPTFIFFTNFLVPHHNAVSCSDTGGNIICYITYR